MKEILSATEGSIRKNTYAVSGGQRGRSTHPQNGKNRPLTKKKQTRREGKSTFGVVGGKGRGKKDSRKKICNKKNKVKGRGGLSRGIVRVHVGVEDSQVGDKSWKLGPTITYLQGRSKRESKQKTEHQRVEEKEKTTRKIPGQEEGHQ